MTATVVAHGAFDGVRHGRHVLDERVNGFGFERDIAGDGLVKIVHVGFVMAIVVDFHCGRIDVRLESVIGVGKRR